MAAILDFRPLRAAPSVATRSVPADSRILVAHEIPGRIRFGMHSLKGNNAVAQSIGARLEALDGVATVRVNLLTGSLVVEYDGAAGTREQIFAALDELGPQLGMSSAPQARVKTSRSWDSKLADAVAKAVVTRLIEDAVHMAVAAVI